MILNFRFKDKILVCSFFFFNVKTETFWHNKIVIFIDHSVKRLVGNFEDLQGDRRKSPGLEPTEPQKYVTGKPKRKYVTGLQLFGSWLYFGDHSLILVLIYHKIIVKFLGTVLIVVLISNYFHGFKLKLLWIVGSFLCGFCMTNAHLIGWFA